MSFELALGTLFITGGIVSYIAWRVERISAAAWFRWGGLFLWIAMLAFVSGSVGQPSIFSIFAILFSVSTWVPFIIFFIVGTIVSLVRGALSLDNVAVRPYYSQAEAEQARGNLQEALRLYREAAAEYPAEAEPCRRAGELYLKLNQPDMAIRSFREAEERCALPEDKAIHVFSIAETLSDHKGDFAAAIQTLERYVTDHPDAAARKYAEQRISLLRKRQNSGNSR